VVEILIDNGAGGYCSGALLPDRMDILTAGHCVEGASQWQVVFQTPSEPNLVAGVSFAKLDPLYAPRPWTAQLHEYDVAVLRLSSPAPPDAATYSVDSTASGISYGLPGDPNATLLHLVGFGAGGDLNVFLPGQVRRAATNTVAFDGFVTYVQSDGTIGYEDAYSGPDNPLNVVLKFSSTDTSLNGYGLLNSGDSGGPLLNCDSSNTDCSIVGVGSYCWCGFYTPASSLPAPNHYYLDGFANVATPEIASFIDSMTLPEPCLSLAVGAALALLARAARRPS